MKKIILYIIMLTITIGIAEGMNQEIEIQENSNPTSKRKRSLENPNNNEETKKDRLDEALNETTNKKVKLFNVSSQELTTTLTKLQEHQNKNSSFFPIFFNTNPTQEEINLWQKSIRELSEKIQITNEQSLIQLCEEIKQLEQEYCNAMISLAIQSDQEQANKKNTIQEAIEKKQEQLDELNQTILTNSIEQIQLKADLAKIERLLHSQNKSITEIHEACKTTEQKLITIIENHTQLDKQVARIQQELITMKSEYNLPSEKSLFTEEAHHLKQSYEQQINEKITAIKEQEIKNSNDIEELTKLITTATQKIDTITTSTNNTDEPSIDRLLAKLGGASLFFSSAVLFTDPIIDITCLSGTVYYLCLTGCEVYKILSPKIKNISQEWTNLKNKLLNKTTINAETES